MNPLIKYALTSGIIVAISEAAKRNDKIGAIIGSLPLMTILAMIWLHVEKQPQEKISNHAYYTFWYVIPTLPMFAIFPIINPKIGFWPSLIVSAVVTVASFFVVAAICKKFGVNLI